MGKKKPFIDKKNSSTYHLLYRSQRDVADDGGGGPAGDGNSNNSNGGGGAASGVVLWPSPNNNRETDRQVLLGKNSAVQLQDEQLQEWKRTLEDAGLVDDYDYEQHLKPVTGTGQILSAAAVAPSTSSSATKAKAKQDNKAVETMLDARSWQVQDEIVREVDRQLDSIALTADCMDEEIAKALFGDFEEGDFEELNDEFVLDAAQEVLETTDDKNNDDGVKGNGESFFDFAAHIASLVQKAKMENQPDGVGGLAAIHEQGQADQEFFSRIKSTEKMGRIQEDYHGRDPNDDDFNGDDRDDESGYFDENDPSTLEDFIIDGTPGIVPSLTEAEEKALCDKFNATLAEYDSDELGEGQDDEDVFGPLPLEGDTQVEAALDDFLQEKKDDIFMQGGRHYLDGRRKNGGSGFSALVGTKMVPIKDLDKVIESDPTTTATKRGGIRPVEDILGEADEALASPHAAPPAEEIFIDGKSYYSEKIRNPWDCESILSTYSNLDNNPVEIGSGTGRRRSRRKPKSKNKRGASLVDGTSVDISAASFQQIRLSDKTGLPLGVLGEEDHDGALNPDEDEDGDDDYDYYDGADDTYMSVNKGEPRRKNETAEEKKLRKLTVKKERQLARMQKKLMKEAFQDEFTKRQQEVLVDDIGGKTVFRF